MTSKPTPTELMESHNQETNLVWNLYGSGYENLGVNGLPEKETLKSPGDDQLLVRVDAVGICYSDVKLIQQGENHPKLAGIDLGETPTRPGHELSLTVIKVGKELQDLFMAGERYAVLPEVIHNNRRMTYGFDIPGALSQFQLIGPELLDTDFGVSLQKIEGDLSFAEASILEPWGSVLSSYDPASRRVVPKKDGSMWIIGGQGSPSEFNFSKYYDLPSSILISDVSPSLEKELRDKCSNIKVRGPVDINEYQSIVAEFTDGIGFDDIAVINPLSSDQIEALLKAVAHGGVINLVGEKRLKGKTRIDAQRIHYDFISLVGNPGPDLSISYGLSRNRSGFLPGGTAALIGAAGPMGQMHLQYAIRNPDGPCQIIAVEVIQDRLSHLGECFFKLADEHNKELHLVNPTESQQGLSDRIFHLIGRSTVDDVILLVPGQDAANEAAALLHQNSLINFFAGTPSGIFLPLDLSSIYLGNLQVTGTSGLGIKHLKMAYHLARNGGIEIKSSIAAVGGMYAAADAVRAAEERLFPGKIIIYPHLPDLPLTSFEDLLEKFSADDISDLRLIEKSLHAEYFK